MGVEEFSDFDQSFYYLIFKTTIYGNKIVAISADINKSHFCHIMGKL